MNNPITFLFCNSVEGRRQISANFLTFLDFAAIFVRLQLLPDTVREAARVPELKNALCGLCDPVFNNRWS